MPQTLDLSASYNPQEIVESVARHLGQVTFCFAAGALIVHDHRGQMVLFRSRPVDDLFLQALQRRLVLSYQLYVGPALTEPEIQVTIYGDAVSGPYEPPRSLLTMPILCGGRVTGMIAIASVFPDVFNGKDLCVMASLTAQVSEALDRIGFVVAPG